MLPSNHLRIIAIIILVVGLGSAIAIYVTAEPTPFDPSGYDRFASKKYIRELERFGGKFAVLSAELSQWLGGLWHGKSLAITVGILSLAMASLLWFIGTPFRISRDVDIQDSIDHDIQNS
jgi:hypothetical protein